MERDPITPADVLDPDDPAENACIASYNRRHHPGGTEAYDDRVEADRERYEEEHGCGSCGGSGYIWDGSLPARCSVCHGRGVIDP